MEQVHKEFDTPHDPKADVKTHFMRLEECRNDAEFLEDNFTPKQLMNKAIGEFIKACGKDGTKGEDLWNDKPEANKTWSNFKTFWKN